MIYCSRKQLQDGNCLLSRVVLLCMLCTCLAGTWFIEQPASSRLVWYPRWESFLVSKWLRVWRVGWWSRHYGALSPLLGSLCNIVRLLYFGCIYLRWLPTLSRITFHAVPCRLQETTPWMEQFQGDPHSGPWFPTKGGQRKMHAEDHEEGSETRWQGSVPRNKGGFEKHSVRSLAGSKNTG